MKAVAIIPVRMGSSRFPGKPLALIRGMPMVGHCYYRTRMTPGLAGTYIATCDAVIADYARSIDASAVMTADTHNRASDRTAEALLAIEKHANAVFDVVVMVQGDEPLITPAAIERALAAFDDPTIEIANVMCRLRTEAAFADKNNVKVVVNRHGDALYFSRETIPSPWKRTPGLPMLMQVGVIAFRREALIRFNRARETILEQCESVDMNRVLEDGGRVRMVMSDSLTIGVDSTADLAEAESLMATDTLVRKYMSP